MSAISVIGALERRALIAAAHTSRAGRLPERTVYALTDAGAEEMRDWLSQLIASPVRDYTAFEAGLSFLPVLAPSHVRALLQTRAQELERQSAERAGSRGLLGSTEVPRLFWIEEEYRQARHAELAYVPTHHRHRRRQPRRHRLVEADPPSISRTPTSPTNLNPLAG